MGLFSDDHFRAAFAAAGMVVARKTVCPPRWGAAWLIEAALW